MERITSPSIVYSPGPSVKKLSLRQRIILWYNTRKASGKVEKKTPEVPLKRVQSIPENTEFMMGDRLFRWRYSSTGKVILDMKPPIEKKIITLTKK